MFSTRLKDPTQEHVVGWRRVVLAVGALGLLGLGCAGGTAGDKESLVLRRQVDVMRARGADDARTIRRLEDRVFLLEDQLETARLQNRPSDAAPGAPAPPLPPPGIRTSEPEPRGHVVPEVYDGGLAPEPGVQVVYEGEALDPRTRRIVLGDDRTGMIEPGPGSDPTLNAGAPRRRRAGSPGVAKEVASSPRARGLPDPEAVTDRLGVAPIPGAGPGKRAAARTAPPDGPADAGPERAYRAAVDALKGHEHAAAIAGLRSFLKRWPAHDFADNAQYWLGEAFYDQRDYEVALGEFRKVIDHYPRGNKAPDALLKVGLTHLGLGDAAQARTVLGEVVTTYPTTDAARLAERRLAEMSPK